jgi:hypothetical protein
VAATLLAAAWSAASADTVTLKDGQTITGKVAGQTSEKVLFRKADGETVWIARDTIESLTRGDEKTETGGPAKKEAAEASARPKTAEAGRQAKKGTADASKAKSAEAGKDAAEGAGKPKPAEAEDQAPPVNPEEAEKAWMDAIGTEDSEVKLQGRWEKAIGIEFTVAVTPPPKKMNSPTRQAMPVQRMLSVAYKLTNRSPFTLKFERGDRQQDIREWSEIAPGKSAEGEWRLWLYAWKRSKGDGPATFSEDNFERVLNSFMHLDAKAVGRKYSEKEQVHVGLSFYVDKSKADRSILSAEDFKPFVSVEVITGQKYRNFLTLH